MGEVGTERVKPVSPCSCLQGTTTAAAPGMGILREREKEEGFFGSGGLSAKPAVREGEGRHLHKDLKNE